MKKVFLTFIAISLSFSLFAQKEKNYEKVRSMKIAYLTEKLDLSIEEAEAFWPIYNEHAQKTHKLRKRFGENYRSKFKDVKSDSEISEEDAKNFIAADIELDEKMLILKKEYYKNLEDVISPQKILILSKSEMDFNKKLIKELRHRQGRK